MPHPVKLANEKAGELVSAKDDLRAKALAIYRRLVGEYGEREWHPRNPLDTLISAILSQNTSDVNRDRAYKRLIERFPTWEAVRDADVAEIAVAIKPAGLSNMKAPRIKDILQKITEEWGELSLDFIADMDVEEARDWLISLKGVGPKTAAIVLLFTFGKPAFPVDTHVYRVSQRLGLIEPKTSANQAHDVLKGLLSPETYYTFHLNLIAHGRRVCTARNPRHEVCVLREYCDYMRQNER